MQDTLICRNCQGNSDIPQIGKTVFQIKKGASTKHSDVNIGNFIYFSTLLAHDTI